jgi:hypothetical protein
VDGVTPAIRAASLSEIRSSVKATSSRSALDSSPRALALTAILVRDSERRMTDPRRATLGCQRIDSVAGDGHLKRRV